MKINLRRAATLQEQIRQAVSDVNLASSGDETTDLEQKLSHLEEVESVLYSLRDKVGKANVETGVSTLLTKRVQLNNLIGRYEKLVRKGEDTFQSKLSDLRKERVTISEKILELNVGSSVELTDEDEQHERAIEAAVNKWLDAWSNQDIDGYLACYAKEFIPLKGSKKSLLFKFIIL